MSSSTSTPSTSTPTGANTSNASPPTGQPAGGTPAGQGVPTPVPTPSALPLGNAAAPSSSSAASTPVANATDNQGSTAIPLSELNDPVQIANANATTLNNMLATLKGLVAATPVGDSPQVQKLVQELRTAMELSSKMSRGFVDQHEKVGELEKLVQGKKLDAKSLSRQNAISIMEALGHSPDLGTGHRKMLDETIERVAKNPNAQPEDMLHEMSAFSHMILTSRNMANQLASANRSVTPAQEQQQKQQQQQQQASGNTTDVNKLLTENNQLRSRLEEINKSVQVVEQQRQAADQRQRTLDALQSIGNMSSFQSGRSTGLGSDPYGVMKQQQQQQQPANPPLNPQSSSVVNASSAPSVAADANAAATTAEQEKAAREELGGYYARKYLNFGTPGFGGVINASSSSGRGRGGVGDFNMGLFDIETLNRVPTNTNKAQKTGANQDVSFRGRTDDS